MVDSVCPLAGAIQHICLYCLLTVDNNSSRCCSIMRYSIAASTHSLLCYHLAPLKYWLYEGGSERYFYRFISPRLYIKPLYYTFRIVVHAKVTFSHNHSVHWDVCCTSTPVYWCCLEGTVCPLPGVIPLLLPWLQSSLNWWATGHSFNDPNR
jgi:hypothetical protein